MADQNVLLNWYANRDVYGADNDPEFTEIYLNGNNKLLAEMIVRKKMTSKFTPICDFFLKNPPIFIGK